MTTTPRGAPELASAQAVPETTVNEQIRRTEAGAGRFPVADRVTAPPGTCADGANYIIIATATGAFAGKENQIATAVGTNAASGWYYRTLGTIDEGIVAYVQDEDAEYKWSGAAWAVYTGSGVGSTASTTEVLTGTDTAKAVTPDSLAALWEKGADIASAGTIAVGEGGLFHVTGTTTITDIDPATDKAGRAFKLVFDGILTLTHNASTLILPTGANITTAAGDVAEFVSEGSDAVRCTSYMRASGSPLGGYTDAQARAAVNIAPTTQSGTNYTAVLGDAAGYIQFTNGAAIAFTIPPNASVAFPIGTVITVEQNGAGVVTLTAGAGVTLNSRGALLATGGQYAVCQVKKVATNTWTVIGDVA